MAANVTTHVLEENQPQLLDVFPVIRAGDPHPRILPHLNLVASIAPTQTDRDTIIEHRYMII